MNKENVHHHPPPAAASESELLREPGQADVLGISLEHKRARRIAQRPKHRGTRQNFERPLGQGVRIALRDQQAGFTRRGSPRDGAPYPKPAPLLLKPSPRAAIVPPDTAGSETTCKSLAAMTSDTTDGPEFPRSQSRSPSNGGVLAEQVRGIVLRL